MKSYSFGAQKVPAVKGGAAVLLPLVRTESVFRPFIKWFKSVLTVASLVPFILAPAGAQAATIAASSPSLHDVSAAIAQAQDGDTVQIPGGSVTWTSGLVITKAIVLIGAGSANTIIANGAGTLITWRPAHDLPFRLSGVRFNSSDSQQNIVQIIGAATQARVDHCFFNKGDSAITTNYMNTGATGPVYGVVDHCSFYNFERAAFVSDVRVADGGAWGATAWTEPILPGSTKMMCWEDNQFVYDSNLTGPSCDATFYGDYGGKALIRHNTFTGYQYAYMDAHGDTPGESTILYEIYSNTFTQGSYGPIAGWFMNQRGGKRIMWGNTFNGSNNVCELIKYWPNDVHIVSDSYFWGDNWNGDTNEADMISVQGPYSSVIVLGQNYFLSRPQPGQTFYPYQPLVYPHPLVSGAAALPAPSAPTNLRISSSL